MSPRARPSNPVRQRKVERRFSCMASHTPNFTSNRLLSPFVPQFREMQEMRYLWRMPRHMGNERLIGVPGEEARTPFVAAVRETLAGLGCLAESAQHRPS